MCYEHIVLWTDGRKYFYVYFFDVLKLFTGERFNSWMFASYNLEMTYVLIIANIEDIVIKHAH